MNWDVVDALTMAPGIIGTGVLAYFSDDFVYRVAVLSWGWTCVCSMIYHLHNCDPKLLKYDLRAQWVSQVFMILETPQYSWPILIGGLVPVGNKGRIFLNGAGAFYFLSHSMTSMLILIAAYAAYMAQFLFKVKWSHSLFHLLVHCAGGLAALSPVKKYSCTIHPDWAWGVFAAGSIILLPPMNLFSLFKWSKTSRVLLPPPRCRSTHNPSS
jgi:hypothetical protein